VSGRKFPDDIFELKIPAPQQHQQVKQQVG